MNCDLNMYDEGRWSKSTVCADGFKHAKYQYEDILDWDVPVETESSAPQEQIVTIGAIPFLKTMWALFWTSFRHPFTNTAIDPTTGEIITDE